MEIRTIGFAGHSAAGFFGLLRAERVGRLIDVRLNNTGQLSGFAKRDDLRFFLDELCGAEYLHEPALLAPTGELLKAYRGGEITWGEYADRFEGLLAARRVESELSPDLVGSASALLCSEHTADRCHRRLVVEYLGRHWGDVAPVHLPRAAAA
ncbi:MAG: DUF488 domain-containing protein [bacterium]|nr:DUF488 domain-containing protein [bacterium]